MPVALMAVRKLLAAPVSDLTSTGFGVFGTITCSVVPVGTFVSMNCIRFVGSTKSVNRNELAVAFIEPLEKISELLPPNALALLN